MNRFPALLLVLVLMSSVSSIMVWAGINGKEGSARAFRVDVARYFTDFLSQESCGKCVPCREGLKQMLQILNNICAFAPI